MQYPTDPAKQALNIYADQHAKANKARASKSASKSPVGGVYE